MSNFLALATVTATLGRMIGEALEQIPQPSGIPRVRFGPPQSDPQHLGCTVFLYRVSVNPFRRNEDLPTRNAGGTLVERPRAVLDADYLLTFAGDEKTLEPQRFLGAVVSALQAQPVIPRDTIKRTIAGLDYLHDSDLDQDAGLVRLAPGMIDHQSMAQLWNTFPQVSYNVSIVYTASAIVIQPDVNPELVPPVVDVRVTRA
jgi:hypothetical protein